jgi:hypothetical protein
MVTAEYLFMHESDQYPYWVNRQWKTIYSTDQESIMVYMYKIRDTSVVYALRKQKDVEENETSMLIGKVPFGHDVQFNKRNYQLEFPDTNTVLVRHWDMPIDLSKSN